MCGVAEFVAVGYFLWSVYVTWRWRRAEAKSKRLIENIVTLQKQIPKHDAKGRFTKRG
jgi:hypothetical protein